MASNQDVALVKQAEELTDRVATLEKQNAELQQLNKQASVVQVPAPVVSEAVAAQTCEKLVKAGALTEEQVAVTKKAFMEDPAAAHRTICGILDAQAQTKSAADTTDAAIYGGTIVSGNVQSKTAEEDCLDRMQRLLGMN